MLRRRNKHTPEQIQGSTRAKGAASTYVLYGLLAIWILLLGFVALNRTAIYDWWRLRGYTAPASISELADEDTMNSYTRHLFYLNRPQLLPTVKAFRADCPENEDTIVLGCYHSGQNGIFIYNVQDTALAGVQQVTAAHEVLHSVYARLSSADRKQLNSELEDFYKHDLTDQRVKAEVALYIKTEPHDVMDEMSCTFGTEVANLPPGLTAYYNKYFTDRSKIVAYEQQYEAAFTTRLDTIAQDDKQLAASKKQIDATQASLAAQIKKIDNDKDAIEALLAANDVTSYNAAVPTYNAEIDSYNAAVRNYENQVAAYNTLVVTRNKVSGELTTLDSAIDTRTTPSTISK